MCRLMKAHWSRLANTIELVLPWANPSPERKRQIDRLCRFAQVTAESHCSAYFTIGELFLKNCPYHGASGPHIIYDSLGQSEPTTQTVSLSVQSFLHSSRQRVVGHARACPFPNSNAHSHLCTDDRRVSVYFIMGRPFPTKNCPFPWGMWTPSTLCFITNVAVNLRQ